MRVLITGATGFIGSHVVRELAAAGHSLRLLARSPERVGPLMARMGIDSGACEVAQGDIVDRESVAAAVDGTDAVVHAAAVVAVEPTREAEMAAVNPVGAENVLGAAAAAGCDPIVHISSVAALFPFETDPVTPDHPVRGETTPYGRSKAACERCARGLQAAGHPVVTIYPSGVIGPDDWNGSVGQNPARLWIERGMPVTKNYASSFVDVRDVAKVIAASMAAGRGAQRLLAMGTFMTAREQAQIMSEAIGGKFKTVPLPQPIWWAWSRLGTLAARFGVDLVLTSDGYEYIFRSKPGDDSATVAATGVEFRPAVETFRDTFAWMHRNGIVAGKNLGTLAVAVEDDEGTPADSDSHARGSANSDRPESVGEDAPWLQGSL